MKKYSIPTNIYERIHYWLRYYYGSANHCENKDCTKESKRFDYALKKGMAYEKNVKNFTQLCRSCHVAYDFTEERRKRLLGRRLFPMSIYKKLAEGRKGKPIHTEATKKRFRLLRLGIPQDCCAKPVIQLSPSGTSKKFRTIREAEKSLHLFHDAIAKYLRKEDKSLHYGYYWRYA